MEEKKRFNELMNLIMGADWKPVAETGKGNNVLGALAHATEFTDFKAHFDRMASGLYGIYRHNVKELDKLVKTFRELADERNWQGAYAELCALHVLNLDGYPAIETDVTLPASESCAAQLGHKADTNMDGYVSVAGLYFDTKAFRDTVTPILKSVTNTAIIELKKEGRWTERKEPYVMYEHDLTDTESEYQSRFRELVDEFKGKYSEKVRGISSDVVRGLVYRIQRDSFCSTISSYSPYRRAKELVGSVLCRYADKFLLRKSFMLVLVNHPWFNQADTGTLIGNEVLYRSLARRLFMQYRYMSAPMYTLNRKFTGRETIDEVTRKISAVMFIDVHSAKKEKSDYSWYFYKNPRADNKMLSSEFYFRELGQAKRDMCREWDDFEDDNY